MVIGDFDKKWGVNGVWDLEQQRREATKLLRQDASRKVRNVRIRLRLATARQEGEGDWVLTTKDTNHTKIYLEPHAKGAEAAKEIQYILSRKRAQRAQTIQGHCWSGFDVGPRIFTKSGLRTASRKITTLNPANPLARAASEGNRMAEMTCC